MTPFAIYDRQGNILRTGKSPNPELQAQEGEFLYVGEVNPQTDIIVNGSPTTKPQDAIREDQLRLLTLIAKHRRGQLLQESDWTQVSDAPVDKEMWATYRQALRDITEQEGFPENIIWPERPL